MKKFILSAAAFLTLSIAAQAQEATIVETENTNIENQIVLNEEVSERVPVKISELPEGIQKALASDKYKGWKANTAFLIKSDAPYYEINVINEKGETKKLNLNEKGDSVKA